MKVQKIVKFTGKNIEEVFSLPCVKQIMKVGNKPLVVLWPDISRKSYNIAEPGDNLVQYTNGSWAVE